MKRTHFTLVEVVVALAILSISIAGFLQLLTAAQNRIIKTNDYWTRTHMLMQAAEYYMLMKQEEPPAITDTFFPYDDYRVDVTYEEIEDLNEEYTGLEGEYETDRYYLYLGADLFDLEGEELVLGT